MKIAFLILMTLVSNIILAQDFPSPFEFTFIDSTVKGSKAELYLKARSFFAKSYNSAQDVIQMDDKEAGKIIGRGAIAIPVKNMYGMVIGNSYVNYTISVDVKDNKYRCRLTNFIHEKGTTELTGSGGSLDNDKPACGWFLMTKNLWVKYKTMAADKANELLASLKTSMAEPKADF